MYIFGKVREYAKHSAEATLSKSQISYTETDVMVSLMFYNQMLEKDEERDKETLVFALRASLQVCSPYLFLKKEICKWVYSKSRML